MVGDFCMARVSAFRLSLSFFLFFSLAVVAQAAQPTCTLSTTNQTVTICTPANGATVSTTFHVNAGATDSNTVSWIGLWVNTQPIVTQNGSVLDANVTLAAGNNQRFVVEAKDSTGAVFKTVYSINISGQSSYSISPQNPTVSEGATLQFTASTASTWSATCGTIDSTGLFTAPLTQPSCSVTGKASDGSGQASTSITISSPITITPSSTSTNVNQTQQFSANESVTWSASCGSINSSGLFTAPSSAGTCTITATASSGTAYTAEATDNVTGSAPSGLNYTTWKFDNARDGLNSKETVLTPANVNATKFGQIFSTALDARVWAQPLYVSGVTIGGVKHNVVYVATANDTVYAVDGDKGTVLWKKSLLVNGEQPGTGSALHSSVLPIVGITGTPVIDPASGTLYVVTHSGTSSGVFTHRLHALNITSGAEKFGAPIVINTGGWDSKQHLQRPGLLLANGNVYIAFGSNEDITPYHGWVFAYNAGTLHLVEVWNDTLGADSGGIWMGASGIPADSSGNLFLTTGNGDWNGTTQMGQSAVKLNGSLNVLDYFTPINHNTESRDDKDLGSGGVLLLPTLSGTHPHEAISCSKLNVVYVLDRDNMGQIGSTKDDVVQQITGQLGGTSGVQNGDKCFSTPAYWNNNVYFSGNNDVLKQFTLNPSTGLLSTTPVHKGTHSYQFPAAQPVISSNGNSNAVLWAFDWKAGTLQAYNASSLGSPIYSSGALGTGIKWTTPTVINGHVYVGLQNKVVGLGLKSGGGGGGTCSAPSSPGAVVCAPTAGQSTTSPVTVQAAGKAASGSVNHMEIWVDGKKINDYAGSTVNTTVSLATGSHALTAVEVDSTGAFLKSTPVSFTVH